MVRGQNRRQRTQQWQNSLLQWWLTGAVCLLVIAAAARGQTPPGEAASEKPAATPTPQPLLQLRYDEDYSYLRDAGRRTEAWDSIKYIPLNRAGDWYLSLGGELRPRYEYFHNDAWGAGEKDDNGYFLQRYLLHADLHMGKRTRAFVQLQSSLEVNRNGGPGRLDEDRLDIHQAFVDYRFDLGNDNSLTVRAGRQEMSFGSSRFVTFREGPNARLSFDGFRVKVKADKWEFNGIAVKPVAITRGFFDDAPEHARSFWGAGGVRPVGALRGTVGVYYFGYDNKRARFDQGTAREQRHTVGTRLAGKVRGWDYNTEIAGQFGSFGQTDIRAYTVSSDTGYTFHKARFTPRLSLKADIASGDDNPRDGKLGTFNALFPAANYFGETSLLGPANFRDLHPQVTLVLPRRVVLTTDSLFFWRDSLRDGVYGPGGNLVRTGQLSNARYVGNQTAATLVWQADRHTTFIATYAHFFTGRFLRETPPGRDVNYFSAWVTYKF